MGQGADQDQTKFQGGEKRKKEVARNEDGFGTTASTLIFIEEYQHFPTILLL